MTQISSLDTGYLPGDLSLYPQALDSNTQLYRATNNATTALRNSLSQTSLIIILQDASKFPDSGLVRIGPAPGTPGRIASPDGKPYLVNGNQTLGNDTELVFYGAKQGNTLTKCVRGFAGSIPNFWPIYTAVSSGVMAEHHNAIRDAILNMETNLGTSVSPSATSLNGILDSLEEEFLAPKPIFRAVPRFGAPPLKVRFQNFSGGDPIKYLWSFGDGATSVLQSPIHTYAAPGVYTVTLNILTALGAQGITTKTNYITVNDEDGIAFFYCDKSAGTSTQTAAGGATVFTFVDQSDGPVVERIWNFDDGTPTTVSDPNVHTIAHTYAVPGEYNPTLIIVFADQTFRRIPLGQTLAVT